MKSKIQEMQQLQDILGMISGLNSNFIEPFKYQG